MDPVTRSPWTAATRCGPAHSPWWCQYPSNHSVTASSTALWFVVHQALIQIPLPTCFPSLTPLPGSASPLRDATLAPEHLAPGCCFSSKPRGSPSAPVRAAGTTHTWLHAHPSAPSLQEPGTPEDMQTFCLPSAREVWRLHS